MNVNSSNGFIDRSGIDNNTEQSADRLLAGVASDRRSGIDCGFDIVMEGILA